MSLNLSHLLNTEQAHAARTINGPLLVIAGAGSGKTRMLTYRIAHMLEEGIDEESILALTFTNKAAKEMGSRIRELVDKPLKKLTTTTFHSFGLGLLKQYIQHLGFKNSITVYDSNDRIALIKEVLQSLDYSSDSLSMFELSQTISDIKTGRKKPTSAAMALIYEEYEKHLKAYNAVDFDDLIVKPAVIFEKKPEVLAALQKRYTHILVDEFQDTSLAQYKIVHYLAKDHQNLCVVGDDDQSIYSWRGANYENLEYFERDFPKHVEIKLERNYRSTPTILEAANSLIVHNTQRKEKRLWTNEDTTSSIRLIHPKNQEIEASIIADEILQSHRKNNQKWDDFAILVRTNSLLETLETRLTERGVPTMVTGGQSFFDRKEIRDLVSYLKVIANPDDDVNLLRIINTPRRGIGRTTLERLRALSDERSLSLYSAVSLMAHSPEVKESTRGALKRFYDLIESFEYEFTKSEKAKSLVLHSLIDAIAYRDHLYSEFSESEAQAEYRIKGLDVFVGMLGRWERTGENSDLSLGDFINRIALLGNDDEEEDDSKVALMTIHASKGLEFNTVYLASVNDGIIPHARSLEENPENIAEERRLFYVAITRARRELIISSTEYRVRNELESPALPSRFLEEIPDTLFDEEDPNEELTTDQISDAFALLRERFAALDR